MGLYVALCSKCHIYLDGQQFFLGVVLDISRKSTAGKERDSINDSLCVVLASGHSTVLLL